MMPESAPGPDDLLDRLTQVRQRIEASAVRAGRDPAGIKLIAVSKTHPPGLVRRAIDAGVSDLGENRVQEADSKIGELGRESARWHLIGHLQANKAGRAVALFDVIHSLDSASLALRLDRLCNELGRDELPVLIQLDLGNEPTKSGATEDELPEIVKAVGECTRLRLIGLMILPPLFEEAELVRPYFRRLREIRDALNEKSSFGGSPGELSMGMTHDYEIAIEEGATFVRIGTAIFGARGSEATMKSH